MPNPNGGLDSADFVVDFLLENMDNMWVKYVENKPPFGINNQQGRDSVKTIYKILFSLCSTFVCCAHSVRAFAASCQLYSALPYDACDYSQTLEDPILDYGIANTNCKGDGYFTFQGYLKTQYNESKKCYKYAGVYDCNTCRTTFYDKKTETFYVSSDLANCTVAYTVCSENTTAATCTTDTQCVTQLGGATQRKYFVSELTEDLVAYADYVAKCNNGHCIYKAPFTFIQKPGTSDVYFSSAGLTCYNANYGNPTIFSQANEFFVVGCTPCPDIDATYTGYWAYANYLRGEGATIASCYIDGIMKNGTAYTKFEDTTGNFDITGDCYY